MTFLRPPVRAGSDAIDGVFDLCVDILMWGADALGISYNEINVWVFCVIWPIFTLLLVVVVIAQRVRISSLKSKLGGQAT